MNNWKVDRDIFYRDVEEDQLSKAGFFEDSCKYNFDLQKISFPHTSVEKIISNIQKNNVNDTIPIILITTGGMNPVHIGHIRMMELAKEKLESEGHFVAGGFIVPDHDEYIDYKKCKRYSREYRVAAVSNATKDSDWLEVSPWAAIHMKHSVNFTDVIVHIGHYIDRFVGQHKICYVSGGDNANFFHAFKKHGMFCAVSRNGKNKFDESSFIQNNENIFWQSEEPPEFSSTYFRETGDRSITVNLPNVEKRKLILSFEGQPFYKEIEINAINKVIDCIEGYFDSVTKINVEILNKDIDKNIISLDPIINGKFNLPLSRMFSSNGYNQIGWIKRPESDKEISDVISDIKNCGEELFLFDDDSFTGGTFKKASSLIGENIILGYKTLIKRTDEEIADIRDFIIGAKFGGLVVRLPNGKIGRVPYFMPFSCPSTRASIPFEFAQEFSVKMLELNKELLSDKKLGDLPEPNREIFYLMGFCDNSSMNEVILSVLNIVK